MIEVGVALGAAVILGTFGNGINLDVMEGRPILNGRRSLKWLWIASIEMGEVEAMRKSSSL